MNLREKLKEAVMKIKCAPDSDDVGSIVRRTINELIEDNIMGLELQLSILFIQKELARMLSEAEDYIEVNNIKRGIEFVKQFEKVLGTAMYPYELN